MDARHIFRALMAERRAWPRGSMDHQYRTAAARKLAALIRGIPAEEWTP